MRFQSEAYPRRRPDVSCFHFHDCDEWLIIVDGIAHVFNADGKIQGGPVDMDFTPIEESQKIEAVTMWSRLSGSRGLFKAKNARATCSYDIICGNDR
jgi:hypothetical protein